MTMTNEKMALAKAQNWYPFFRYSTNTYERTAAYSRRYLCNYVAVIFHHPEPDFQTARFWTGIYRNLRNERL